MFDDQAESGEADRRGRAAVCRSARRLRALSPTLQTRLSASHDRDELAIGIEALVPGVELADEDVDR